MSENRTYVGSLDRSWYHRIHVHGYHVKLRNKIYGYGL